MGPGTKRSDVTPLHRRGWERLSRFRDWDLLFSTFRSRKEPTVFRKRLRDCLLALLWGAAVVACFFLGGPLGYALGGARPLTPDEARAESGGQAGTTGSVSGHLCAATARGTCPTGGFPVGWGCIQYDFSWTCSASYAKCTSCSPPANTMYTLWSIVAKSTCTTNNSGLTPCMYEATGPCVWTTYTGGGSQCICGTTVTATTNNCSYSNCTSP